MSVPEAEMPPEFLCAGAHKEINSKQIIKSIFLGKNKKIKEKIR